MTTKQIALQIIEGLPDSVSWSEIEERIRFLSAIDKGMQEINRGNTIPHDKVKESVEQWLSK